MSHRDNYHIPVSTHREAHRKNLNRIGKSAKRVEDSRILVGKGRYVDHVVLPNMAHAGILRSPLAHAQIKSTDTSKAETLPGVILVMTGAQAAEVTGPGATFSSPPVVQYCLAIGKVRHVGEAAVAVVAKYLYIAEDAIDLIEVEYEPWPINVDPEQAILASGDAVIHPDRGPTNYTFDSTFKFGTVDEDFAAADIVVRRHIKWGRSGPQPLETCGAVAEFDGGSGQFTVHAHSNFYAAIGFIVAGSLKIPATYLKVIPTIAGGSFGSKLFNHKKDHTYLHTCERRRKTGQVYGRSPRQHVECGRAWQRPDLRCRACAEARRNDAGSALHRDR